MTNQEKILAGIKEEIENGPEKTPLIFLKPYAWSPDAIHALHYERGKTYTKYPEKLYKDLQKESIPVATYGGKVIEPYENKLMPAPENKDDVLGKFLDTLSVPALKAMCQSKKVDTKQLSKQEMINALKSVK